MTKGKLTLEPFPLHGATVRPPTGRRRGWLRGRPEAALPSWWRVSAPTPTLVIRLHRHRLGPRVFVLGRRVHEWHLGLGVLALVGVGVALDAWHLTLVPAVAGALGIWLVAKDWQDVMPSRRDTAAWRIGLHRRTAPLRAIRRGEGLPSLAAAIAFAVGLVNLASALTPTIAWRHHLLLQLEPMEAVPVFHTLAVPASIALVVVAFYLRARRHRAWQVAIGLMLALAAIQLLKGLDFEEAALSLGAAGLLWWGRDAFYVRHRPLRAAPPAVIALVARRRRLRQPRRLGDRLRPASGRARLAAAARRGARPGRHRDAHRPPVPAARLAEGASLRRGAQRGGRPRSLARLATRSRSSSCAATPTTGSPATAARFSATASRTA